MLTREIRQKILIFQKNEITEYFIYQKLVDSAKTEDNKRILIKIAEDEKKHYEIWKKYTEKEIKPSRLKIYWYYVISRIFGLTFGLKLMEKGERAAQNNYSYIFEIAPETRIIAKEEAEHENELLNLIDEERLQYISSVVLGLNDALVELTGALAGLTFAFRNTRLIAVAGLVTGIAAALSMAASEYLSIKSEANGKNPLKASFYTGSTYILTVLFLIWPFLYLEHLYLCLGISVINAIIAVFFFSFYMSVAKDVQFKKRFYEMAAISLGVAALSFIIGFFVRKALGIEI